jgi:hypothetical protein
MSGNVLEVRYKLISRQMESMNHTISSLGKLEVSSGNPVTCELAEAAMKCHEEMRAAGHVRLASGHPYLGIIHRIISMAAK